MNTTITETTENGEIPVDVYQKLANDRILFLEGFIDDKIASDICATLLLKDVEDPDREITLIINSEGGDIRSCLMIYDMMQIISCPVKTICIGAALNESVIILVSGTNGMRFATKNSIVTISQLSNDWAKISNLTDAKKSLESIVRDNKRMMEIISFHSKKPLSQVLKDCDNKKQFFTAPKAVKYGLIDKVIKFKK